MSIFNTEENSLPRSIRWKIQLGLLKLPKLDIEGRKEINDGSLDSPSHGDLIPHPLQTLVEGNISSISFQRAQYSILSKRYEKKLEAADKEVNVDSNISEGSTPLNDETDDPLTAMVKKQEAFKHRADARNEDKRRQSLLLKRFSQLPIVNKGDRKESPETPAERLDVIQKDIKRIDPEHTQYYYDRLNQQLRVRNLEELHFEEAVLMRNACLRKILFIYAEENGVYFQGFHEICSYLMLVIEMDLAEREERLENAGYDDNERHLLNHHFLYHDTYTLFETLMEHLLKCYEESDEISNSVVTKIPYVACDKELYNLIQSIPMEHETYCSRWIRLMMSREVDDIESTFDLWDIFIDLISEEPSIVSQELSYYEQLGTEKRPFKLGGWELDEVLEMTAASLIWLKRDDLLAVGADNALEILLDSQPLQDTDTLVETLLLSLNRLQNNQHMAPVSLPTSTRRKSSISLKSLTNFIKPGLVKSDSSDSLALYFEDIDESQHSTESASSISDEFDKQRRRSTLSSAMFGSSPGDSNDVVNIINLKNIVNMKSITTKQKNKEDFGYFDKCNESLEYRSTFHRDRTVQKLVDTSTCVSTLIYDSEDSEDSENYSDYDSSDDMSTESFAADETYEEHQDSSFLLCPFPQDDDGLLCPFPQEEEGVKVPNFKRRSSISFEKGTNFPKFKWPSGVSSEEGAKVPKFKWRSNVSPEEGEKLPKFKWRNKLPSGKGEKLPKFKWRSHVAPEAGANLSKFKRSTSMSSEATVDTLYSRDCTIFEQELQPIGSN